MLDAGTYKQLKTLLYVISTKKPTSCRSIVMMAKQNTLKFIHPNHYLITLDYPPKNIRSIVKM